MATVRDDSPTIPYYFLCPVCNELLRNATSLSCCGTSFCNDCIWIYLLRSESHICFACNKSLSDLKFVANKSLQKLVDTFKNSLQTGYNNHAPQQVQHAAPPLQPPGETMQEMSRRYYIISRGDLGTHPQATPCPSTWHPAYLHPTQFLLPPYSPMPVLGPGLIACPPVDYQPNPIQYPAPTVCNFFGAQPPGVHFVCMCPLTLTQCAECERVRQATQI